MQKLPHWACLCSARPSIGYCPTPAAWGGAARPLQAAKGHERYATPQQEGRCGNSAPLDTSLQERFLFLSSRQEESSVENQMRQSVSRARNGVKALSLL